MFTMTNVFIEHPSINQCCSYTNNHSICKKNFYVVYAVVVSKI